MPQNRHFDLNLLRVFISVCQLGSFTKAAEALGLTQSSVSNAINRLKTQLGEELFIRVGRGIQPTNFALQLLMQLETSILNIDTVLQQNAEFDPCASSRTFNVYAMDSIIHIIQPKVIELLKDSKISIIFRELSGQVTLPTDELLTETADLVFDVSMPAGASFKCENVAEKSLSCVVSNNHPRIQRHISREQYFTEKHAFLNMRRINLALVDYFTDEILPRRNMYSEHGSIMSMLTTISVSDAIGIAPTDYAQQYAALLNLQVLPMPLACKPITIYMIHTNKLNNNPANKWLRETLKSLF